MEPGPPAPLPGVWCHEKPGVYCELLRFEPGGDVLGATLVLDDGQTPEAAWDQIGEWFRPGGGPNVSTGRYTRDGAAVAFLLTSNAGVVEYQGEVRVDGTLALDLHSRINGYQARGVPFRKVDVKVGEGT